MAGTHNFKVFDEALANMTPDASYGADAARVSGAQPNSMADPLSSNKAWHQATIMTAAIAQYIANQGVSIDDTNLPNLVAAIAASITSPAGISFADRIAHALQAAADIGQISLCPAQPTPPAATYAATGTGNLNGAYIYREVLISGYKNPDGTYFVRGFSPAASRSAADVSPASQQVTITNLPTGSSGCIGRAIYRSAAGGAAGSEQFCGVVWDNTATTYTDNKVDSQLGTGMPTVQGTAIPAAVPTANTTGTTLSVSQILNAVAKSTLVPATLTAVGWTGSSAPYSQALSIAAATATSANELLPGASITADQLAALQAANIQDGGQAAGSIALLAYGDKPTVDLPVRIIVRGDL